MLVFMCSQDLRLYNEVFMSVYFLFNFFCPRSSYQMLANAALL